MLFLYMLALSGVQAPVRCGSLAMAAKSFDDAQLHHDRRSIEALLAPDFQYVTRTGTLLGPREFADATADPTERLAPFVVRDHRVLALGADGGIASGDATVTGTHAGRPFEDRFRYSDVFARRKGCWSVTYTQVTALKHP